jgi:hypothetical protein
MEECQRMHQFSQLLKHKECDTATEIVLLISRTLFFVKEDWMEDLSAHEWVSSGL